MERPIIHTTGTIRPMSAVEYYEQTQAMYRQLEDRERGRAPDLASARRRLARRLGALPGTIESLARNRLKSIDGYLRSRIEALLITEIQHEIAALTHELDSLKACGAEPHSPAILEATAALETARKIMRGET